MRSLKVLLLFLVFLSVPALASKQQQIRDTMNRVENALADLAMNAQYSFSESWQNGNGTCKHGCSHLACGRESSITALQCYVPSSGEQYGSQENLCPSSNTTAAPTFASGVRRSMDDTAILLPPGFNYQSTSTAAFVCSTKNLTSAFQAKAESDELNGFTYIADVASGAIRSYPAVPQDPESDLCTSFDSRDQSWMIASATGGKDVVVIVDTTDVMNEVTAWKQQTRLQLAKDSIKEILSGLNSRDRVAVIGASSGVSLLASNGASTYGATSGTQLLDGHLLRASSGNVSSIESYINQTINNGKGYSVDLEGSFSLAFNMLNNSYKAEGARPDNNRPIILVLSSGILSNLTTSMSGVNNAIEQGQSALTSGRAYIRTYTIASSGGSYATESHLLRQIGCENEGIWEQIPDVYGRDIDPVGVVGEYYDFLTAAESAAITTNTSNVAWTSPYTSPYGAGTVVTASKPVLVGGKVVGIVATDVAVEEFGASTSEDNDLLEEILLRATMNPLEQKPPTWCETQYARDKKSGYLCEAPDAPVGSNTTCPTVTTSPQIDVNTTFCHNRTTLENTTSEGETLAPACCYDALPPTPVPTTPTPPTPAPPSPVPPPTPAPPSPVPPSPAPETPVPSTETPPTPVPETPVPPTTTTTLPPPVTPHSSSSAGSSQESSPSGGELFSSSSSSSGELKTTTTTTSAAPDVTPVPETNAPTAVPPSGGTTPVPTSPSTIPPGGGGSGSSIEESSSTEEPTTTRVVRITTTTAPNGPGTPPGGGPGTPVPFNPGVARGSRTRTLSKSISNTAALMSSSSSSSEEDPSGGAPPTPIPGGGGGGGGGGGSKTPTLTLTLSLTKTLTLTKSLSLTPDLVFNAAAADDDEADAFWWWWILLIVAGVILCVAGAALARRKLTHRSKGSNKFLDNTKYTKFFDVDVDQAMLEADERPVAEMEAEMNLKYVMKDEGGAGPEPSDMDLQAVIAGAKAGKLKVTESSTSKNIKVLDETADVADANRRNDHVLNKSAKSFLGVTTESAGLADTLTVRSPNRSPLADTLQVPLSMTTNRLGGTLRSPLPVMNLADTLNLGTDGMSQMRFEDADELSLSDDGADGSAAVKAPPLSQVLAGGNGGGGLRLPPQRLDATVESLNLEMTQGEIPVISTQRPSVPPGGGGAHHHPPQSGVQANGGYHHHLMDPLPESGGSRMIFLDI